MKRILPALIVLLVVATACGDDDAASTTAPPTQATTAAPDATPAPTTSATTASTTTTTATPQTTTTAGTSGGTGSDDFCGVVAGADVSDLDFGLDPDTVRAAMNQSLEAMRNIQDRAPAEIRDDLAILLDGFEGFVELLEEVNYNFIALGTSAANDPRMLRFEDEDFVAALDRIGSFCGVDFGAGGGGTSGGGPSGTMPDIGTELPDDFPEALVPPAPTSTLDMGGTGTLISSAASFDQLVEFYQSALGTPTMVQAGELALWTTQYQGKSVTVSITPSDNGADVFVSLGS